MNDSVIDIFSLCRFFFKFGGNLTGRWYLHSEVCQNAHLLFFKHKAPTFTSWGFVIT